MKTKGLVLIAGVTLAIALAATFGVWHQKDPATASPLVVVGIDMDPSGNSCPGTGTADCTLGSIETCRSVPNVAGTTFTIDTFIQGLTNGFLAWSHNLEFPDIASDAKLTVTGQTETSSTLNLSVQSVGSSPIVVSEDVPDSGTFHYAAVAEFGTAEMTPPFTQGVLARLEFTVGEGATSGLYGLTLPPIFIDARDSLNNAYVIDQIWDAAFTPQFGLIALGQDCPPAPTFTPTPTTTVTPTPAPTISPTPEPTATPTPGSVPLVAGWNDSCYQGQAQPIGDAFTAIVADVQAVYRMNPGQTFDRWFPTRPELSNITTLNPFDQLLILAGSNATWTVQSLAPLPSSIPLNAGWNSVCYLGEGKDTAAAAAGISGAFSIIYSLPPGQVWRRYVSGRPELSDLARLETFTSVLVLMTEPAGGTWAFGP